MIAKLWRRFANLPLLLQIILLFCIWGTLLNAVATYRDMSLGGPLLRLHLGFLVLYAGQVVFILLQERMVFILAFLQGLVALGSNFDFTFVPIIKLLGNIYYLIHGALSVEEIEVYKYVFVSCCFTLDMLKTALLFILLPSTLQQSQSGAEVAADTTDISQ